MAVHKTINVVWVKRGRGVGLESSAMPDTMVRYAGETIIVEKHRDSPPMALEVTPTAIHRGDGMAIDFSIENL